MYYSNFLKINRQRRFRTENQNATGIANNADYSFGSQMDCNGPYGVAVKNSTRTSKFEHSHSKNEF